MQFYRIESKSFTSTREEGILIKGREELHEDEVKRHNSGQANQCSVPQFPFFYSGSLPLLFLPRVLVDK